MAKEQAIEVSFRTGKRGKGKLLLTDKAEQVIESAAGIGCSLEQIGHLLGYPRKEWNAMLQDQELRALVEDAMEFGNSRTQMTVGAALVREASKGSFAHIRWFEMTRAGRAEKFEGEVESHGYVALAPPPLPGDGGLDEWEKRFSPAASPDSVVNPTGAPA